ncbi:MAG: DUF504 domain-containing protein [Candidatus Hydrothermarchaeales archaeon]
MSRRILNELLWHPQKSPEGVEVIYIHRGAPNDRMKILAGDISELGKSFFTIKIDGRDTQIPYHRIVEIKRSGKTLWRKNAKRGKSK